MAEHDEIVRKAAEALVSGTVRPSERFGGEWIDVADILAPFFAAARKEAREGALEEADSALDELANHPDSAALSRGAGYRSADYYSGVGDALASGQEALRRIKAVDDLDRALRSKPKEEE